MAAKPDCQILIQSLADSNYESVCWLGCISVTRTQVDLLFGHRQVCSDIRRAGFELAPG